MASKSELKKMLESLIAEADEITQLYESSQQRLYLNLVSVYLWWREATTYCKWWKSDDRKKCRSSFWFGKIDRKRM